MLGTRGGFGTRSEGQVRARRGVPKGISLDARLNDVEPPPRMTPLEIRRHQEGLRAQQRFYDERGVCLCERTRVRVSPQVCARRDACMSYRHFATPWYHQKRACLNRDLETPWSPPTSTRAKSSTRVKRGAISGKL